MTAPADLTSSAARRLLSQLRAHVGSTNAVIAYAVVAVASGLGEAGVIVAVAAGALAVAAKQPVVDIEVGPLAVSAVPTATVLWGGTALLVVVVLARLAGAWIGARLSTNALVAARARALGSFLQADWETQSSERLGMVHELASVHAIRMSLAVHQGALGLASLLGFLSLVAAAIVVAPFVALFLLAGAGLVLAMLRPLVLRTRRHASAHLSAHNELVDTIEELVGVLPEMRVFGVRDAMLRRVWIAIQDAAGPHRRTRFLTQAVPAMYLAITMGMLLAGIALLSAIGNDQVLALGAVVLFTLRSMRYAMTAQTCVQGLMEQAPHLDELDEAVARFAPDDVTPTPTEPVLQSVGSISFEAVGYRYPSGERALDGVDLQIRRGEVLGVVGPSGAGKSTLIQLLLGLRTPTSGRIVVDGRDLRTINPAQWHGHLGYVSQHPGLIGGDVEDNVRFLRDGMATDTIERAISAASLDDDIGRWEDGLARRVGAAGRELSGGQRQRIALARALAGNPDLLVLDEPTSALDATSELRIRGSIGQLRGDTTVVVVAHRPSTLEVCDRVVVIEEGQCRDLQPDTDTTVLFDHEPDDPDDQT